MKAAELVVWKADNLEFPLVVQSVDLKVAMLVGRLADLTVDVTVALLVDNLVARLAVRKVEVKELKKVDEKAGHWAALSAEMMEWMKADGLVASLVEKWVEAKVE